LQYLISLIIQKSEHRAEDSSIGCSAQDAIKEGSKLGNAAALRYVRFSWWAPIGLTVRLFCSKNIPGERYKLLCQNAAVGLQSLSGRFCDAAAEEAEHGFYLFGGVVNHTIQRGR
jgi:hypothetical protein